LPILLDTNVYLFALRSDEFTFNRDDFERIRRHKAFSLRILTREG